MEEKRCGERIFTEKPVRDHLEAVGVNGWIVLKDLKETGCEGLAWT
jgi:hypothetical protein